MRSTYARSLSIYIKNLGGNPISPSLKWIIPEGFDSRAIKKKENVFGKPRKIILEASFKGRGDIINTVSNSIGMTVGRRLCRGLPDDPTKMKETIQAFNELLCQRMSNSEGCNVCR